MSQSNHVTTSTPSNQSIDKFLTSVFNLSLNEVLKKRTEREEPVIRFKKPEELKKLLSLELEDEPENHETLLKYCVDVVKYSVKTGHPHFYNQLYAGLDPYGFAGQIITDVLNTSMFTYEVAPVFTLMEQEILDYFCGVVGYGKGDGTLAPGGSYSNMLGMNLARFHKYPEVKEKGLHGLPRLVAFVSADSHYSLKKNGSLLGLGSDNVVGIECDDKGKMKMDDLERQINEAKKQNGVPFMVVATSGTTVFGAYDPLIPISDICKKYGLWLHVDAAWGGGALLSKKHKYLCEGIERSDSVAWNPHKMAMAPIQCCIFVTKHLNILNSCHTTVVPYLFQQDKKAYDPSFDVGTKIVQCGRKVDSLKLWLMWKAIGHKGMNARIDKAYENSRYLADLVKKTEGFKLISEPEATNVCFWFIPENMRNLKWDLSDHEFCRKLSAVAPLIKEKMAERGTTLIGYQPLGKLPNFFRMIVISDYVTFADMDFVVKEISDIGKLLWGSSS